MVHWSKSQLYQLFLIRSLALLGQAATLLYFALTIGNAAILYSGALGVVALASLTAVSAFYFRAETRVTDLQLFQQITIDVIGWSFIMYLTGGATNPFISYLLVPIIVSAAVLNQRFTILVGIAALCAYTVLLNYHQPFGLLSPSGGHLSMSHTMSSSHTMGMWLNFVFSALLVVVFVTRMAQSMRAREQKEVQYREQNLRDEQIRAVATIAANTAHELGSPLNTLTLLSDELRQLCPDDDQARRLFDELDSGIDQCARTLRKLASNAEFDVLSTPQDKDSKRWLEQVIEGWLNKRPAVQLSFKTLGSGQAPMIHIDQTLTPALENLLNNASESGTDSIDISIDWDEDTVSLHIQDYGSGIPEDIRQQIGKGIIHRSTKGLGLGLLLSHATIEKHQGQLLYHQPKQGGTLMTVVLPRSDVGEA